MKRLFLTIIMAACIFLLISDPISIVFQSYNGMTKDVSTSFPNSAGGVNVKIMFKNTSDKTIKYIYINCTPYNAVDDVVPCSIRGYKVLNLSITGPIEPNTGNIPEYMWKYWGNLDYDGVYLAEFENVWYNSTIKYAVVDKIEIVYMDNSREVLTKPFHHIFLLNIPAPVGGVASGVAPIGRPVTQSAQAISMKAQFGTQGVATVSEGNIGSAPEASQGTYSNIANRVASLKGRITTIYIAENNLRPQAGSVSVTLYIGADGSVKAADVVPQSGDLTTEFLQKVQQNVMSWRFSVSEMAKYRFVMQFRK